MSANFFQVVKLIQDGATALAVLLRLVRATRQPPRLIQVRLADSSTTNSLAVYVFKWDPGLIVIQILNGEAPMVNFLHKGWTIDDVNRLYRISHPELIEGEHVNRFYKHAASLLDQFRVAVFKRNSEHDFHA